LFAAHSPLANAGKLTMPVFIAHGAADTTIPISQSRQLARVLTGPPTFHYEEIPGGDHNAPLPAVARAIEWVMGQLEKS